ncbi:MAG: hypothetical protein IPJ41_04780 [Phycisphaerales bacterium]|nr:hypothetical protein [Phycisphaerales bacterium]
MSKQSGSTAGACKGGEANRLGLDYRREAVLLGAPPVPIIDAHAHINGRRASKLWAEAADLYGVSHVYTMSRLSEAEQVREVLGDRARFIAFPDWSNPEKERVHRDGYLPVIERYREEFGAKIVKFWSAPQLRDLAGGDPDDLVALDSPWRVRQAELATSLGMMIMVHIADPDSWFGAKYADGRKYGDKASQYAPLERMLERFSQPWIAAHTGGWPERPDFLDGLLERHSNLFLDTSATKWMVREYARHPRERLLRFFERWRGRLLFGSDIVTMDAHLSADKAGAISIKADQASDADAAFDLYASRYWALRTMFETDYDGPSPIDDPDADKAGPRLRGLALPAPLLRDLYANSARDLLERD